MSDYDPRHPDELSKRKDIAGVPFQAQIAVRRAHALIAALNESDSDPDVI